jgi:hypothetical protein
MLSMESMDFRIQRTIINITQPQLVRLQESQEPQDRRCERLVDMDILIPLLLLRGPVCRTRMA